VDPDAWLHVIDGRAFVRRVMVEHHPSSVKQALVVEAHTRQFVIIQGNTQLKRVPITGLIGARLPQAHFIEHMGGLARSQARLRQLQ